MESQNDENQSAESQSARESNGESQNARVKLRESSVATPFFMYSNSYMAINMTVIAKTKDICRSFDYN